MDGIMVLRIYDLLADISGSKFEYILVVKVELS